MISYGMQMGAIAQYYSYEQVVLLAREKGVDVLAMANQLQYDPDIAAKTIAIVKQLLHEGKLTSARIDESYARIVKCKERLGKIQ
jgi:beta-N-acetylhexosaminidase